MPRRFTTTLPPSPLSYDGQIVKVCWCVRLRLFLPQGQESLAEVIKRAPKMGKDEIILMNLSGRGDKDIFTVGKILGMEL